MLAGILLGCMFFFEACSNSNQTGCKKFRTGNFYFHSRYNGLEYFLHRSDSSQTEISKNTGIKTMSKIQWISDCEYNLKYMSRDLGGLKKDPSPMTLLDLNFKIISSSEKYYIFLCKIPNTPDQIIDTIWVIND